jgi:predicted nucleotidyltransferase
MRLSKDEVKILKNTLHTLNSDAKLYLFGSRLYDNKKGGDIDLLIVSKTFTKKLLRKLRVEFFKYFGEQKLDIIVDDGSFSNPFHKIAYQKAIQL